MTSCASIVANWWGIHEDDDDNDDDDDDDDDDDELCTVGANWWIMGLSEEEGLVVSGKLGEPRFG